MPKALRRHGVPASWSRVMDKDTISHVIDDAVELIDSRFGNGTSKFNPQLLAAVIQVAALSEIDESLIALLKTSSGMEKALISIATNSDDIATILAEYSHHGVGTDGMG